MDIVRKLQQVGVILYDYVDIEPLGHLSDSF
jgi:hypothetical protein